MMDVRLMKKRNGELVLQKYSGVGQNRWGHVVFGWADVETVDEYETDERSSQSGGDVGKAEQSPTVHRETEA